MICFKEKIAYNLELTDTLYFDIETTGFSAKNSYCYLIGVLYKDNEDTFIKQWFLDDINTEKEMLSDFMTFLEGYTQIISFNGDGFDIPFINQRLAKYKIMKDLSFLTSIDIYKSASKLKKVLNLANLKQKTLEQFLGIYREDKFSGGDLISVYHAYLESKDQRLLKTLLLHNFEDVNAMPTLMNIFNYVNIFEGLFDITNTYINVRNANNDKKEFIIEGNLHNNIMSRFSFGYGDYYFTAYENIFKMKINIYTGGLKFFYKEYKDYYYLPNEDMAIHKSVAFYVDKDFKTKAKAANCYSKKTGNFIPQPNEIIEPFFKIEYNDKTSYIELSDDLLFDNEKIKKYVLKTINYLLKK